MNGNNAVRGPKAWAAVIAVFITGMVVGGSITAILIRNHVIHVMRHGRPPIHEMVAARLTGDLDLSTEQREALDGILGEYGPRFEEFDRASRAEVRAIAEEMEGRIRTILTPQQQVRYDENVARMHERFGRRAKRK